jgi:hypothetical protein
MFPLMTITQKTAEKPDSFVSISFSPKNELEAYALMLMFVLVLSVPVIAYFWGKTDGKDAIVNQLDDYELGEKVKMYFSIPSSKTKKHHESV